MIINQQRKKELINLVESLKLEINNFDLLNLALTHGSYVKEAKIKNLQDNERLEFFGDAVLKLFVSEYLMREYPSYSEGELSKLRAYVISDKILVNIARKLYLAKYLLLGKNEKKNLSVSILANSLEALLAVIYYECGGTRVKEFILEHWKKYINIVGKNVEKDNHKAVLQEYLQAIKIGLPLYRVLSESGPDHDKEFEIGVFLNNNKLATGCGKTKKEASQRAAKNALIILKSKKVKNK